MLRPLERTCWELHSAENVSSHYSLTIQRWHDNWMRNAELVKAKYGERWFRIWHLFLAWSASIAMQGNAACFQLVLNKNLDQFDRARWIRRSHGSLSGYSWRARRRAARAKPWNVPITLTWPLSICRAPPGVMGRSSADETRELLAAPVSS
jgi:cyclopropane-fatty-acyl-phospholipid synthase